jgi:hypothetical protein
MLLHFYFSPPFHPPSPVYWQCPGEAVTSRVKLVCLTEHFRGRLHRHTVQKFMSTNWNDDEVGISPCTAPMHAPLANPFSSRLSLAEDGTYMMIPVSLFLYGKI